MLTKTCPQCNKSFVTDYKTQVFCSRKCYDQSISRKIQITCPICKKTLYTYRGAKFCSKNCADSARRGVRLHDPIMKVCPICNNEFESKYPSHRFCSQECSAKGKHRPSKYNITEEGKLSKINHLKEQWKDDKFRKTVVERMKLHNPSYNPEIVKKANISRSLNGKMHNNFKYGNGKISPYEKKVDKKLSCLGFVYNHAIPTKIARELDPDAHYANNYKPDFVHLGNKLCIEIDGAGHSSVNEKMIDAKKEKCLNILGYKVIRFSHKDIDEGVFDAWLNSYQNNMFQTN